MSASIYRGKFVGQPDDVWPEASTDFSKCRCEQTPFELVYQALKELQTGEGGREVKRLGHNSDSQRGESLFITCGEGVERGYWIELWEDGFFEIGEPAA